MFEYDKSLNLIVAVSGGADSMVLLHMLHKYYPLSQLYVVTVNHNIREQGMSDCLFVQNECCKLNIECSIENIDAINYAKVNKTSIETSCRILRYQVLNKYLLNDNYRIALAHHLDDNCETILMHIFRGSGVTGLIGIADNNKYIHPLLDMTRQEILDYASANNVTYINDDTNFDNKYNRNFIRNEIIPLISSRYPIASSLNKLSANAKQVKEFINKMTPFDKIKIIDNNVHITTDSATDSIIIRNLITYAFNKLDKYSDISSVNFLDIESLINKQVGRKICLNDKYFACRTYEGILIGKDDNIEIIEEFQMPFNIGTYKLSDGILNIETYDYNKSLNDKELSSVTIENRICLQIDRDKLPEDCIIRHRKDGDIFSKFGSKGKDTKKLKDYLINQKIPLNERNKLYVIAFDSIVYAIINKEISQKVAITKSTKNILKISFDKLN